MSLTSYRIQSNTQTLIIYLCTSNQVQEEAIKSDDDRNKKSCFFLLDCIDWRGAQGDLLRCWKNCFFKKFIYKKGTYFMYLLYIQF